MVELEVWAPPPLKVWNTVQPPAAVCIGIAGFLLHQGFRRSRNGFVNPSVERNIGASSQVDNRGSPIG